MEYEIDDEPQGEEDEDVGDRDGGIVEDHAALKHQSSVEPEDYPLKERRDQSLVNKKER
jgi:hypothetical protein